MNKHSFLIFKKTIIYLIIIFLFFTGCRTIKKTELAPEIPEHKPEKILKSFNKNQSDFDWFSARFTGSINWENKRHDISGTIRIKKDEKIYISISPILGIEIARTIITPDTVKFLNRINSTYYIGHMGFINSFLHTSLDYDILQAILIGNDFTKYENNSFKTSTENGLVMLHDPNRQPLINPNDNQTKAIEQNLWIDPDTYKIRKNLIRDISTQHKIKAEYEGFKDMQDETMPTNINLAFSGNGYNADLSLQYMRLSINEPQEMKFSVPSRYKPIDFK